eukprot:CAMPEP_0184335762 /NCGR_PEP_ID=MMETSP1089-20130417/4274_1 /TAXON_ID=38269 ORGANISM="Gloeochaete wittrockiana, Strain SAG46.84" /NCGR_SAMPLE_ID=MMETSP1089 /ASSEMBLY_ACC=CAM_ASM_000445 /LENGTH=358 /DNA_ID=CAMNT_0026660589 /DNA_START=39 /DNA_END=1115 /DNA_ORIENTATION=+
MEEPQRNITPIKFFKEEQSAASSHDSEILESEREKHKKRAARFGVEYSEPVKISVEKRPASKREFYKPQAGFVTGIDLDDEEEKRKREARALKYGVQEQQDPDVIFEKKRKQREAKFGKVAKGDQMDLDLRDSRKDCDVTVERRPEAIHLYGTDDMNTTDILKYFTEYGPTWVDWINDSSCNVVFEDIYTAKRAIKGMVVGPVETEGVVEPALASEGNHLTEDGIRKDATEALPLGWFLCKPHPKASTLQMRYATVQDVKLPESVRPPSKWDRRASAPVMKTSRKRRKRNRRSLGSNRSESVGDDDVDMDDADPDIDLPTAKDQAAPNEESLEAKGEGVKTPIPVESSAIQGNSILST